MSNAFIFGDSNVMLFRDLHRQPGCEHWRPDARNPVEACPVLLPDTIVQMKWTAETSDLRTLDAYAFVAATAGALGKHEATGGMIRQIIEQNRGTAASHLVFHFGQVDLDFVLFHILGKTAVHVDEWVGEVAIRYIDFIASVAGEGSRVSILGVHPPTVADDRLIAFFQRYKLDLPRFRHARSEEIITACPYFALQSRCAVRRNFETHIKQLCAVHGFDYLDIGPELADGFKVRPEFVCDDPLEVHVSLPHVLVLWLSRLRFLRANQADRARFEAAPHL